MESRDDCAGTSVPTSSDGAQGDDSQDGYVVEALDSNSEDDLGTTAENADGGLEAGQLLHLSVDGQSEQLPGCSNETPEAKKSKLSAATANFTFNGQFYKRRFVGETSGGLIATRVVSGDTVNEILIGIWDVAKSALCREVIFMDENDTQLPTWAEDDPVFEDMNKFVVLQDQSQKRRVNIEKVNSKLLASWRSKQIRVHVHVYSTSISSKSLWEVVEKKLIRHRNSDRSGAPSNQAVTVLVEELRRKHEQQLQGQTCAWRLWANYIHAGPAHERDRRTSELPPQHLLKFFRSVPISEAVKLESVRSGLSVANTINQGFSAELDVLEENADQMIYLGQQMKNRVAAMRARSAINSGLVSAMTSAVRPEEDKFSRSIAEKVSDMLDLDHM